MLLFSTGPSSHCGGNRALALKVTCLHGAGGRSSRLSQKPGPGCLATALQAGLLIGSPRPRVRFQRLASLHERVFGRGQGPRSHRRTADSRPSRGEVLRAGGLTAWRFIWRYFLGSSPLAARTSIWKPSYWCLRACYWICYLKARGVGSVFAFFC